MTRPAGGKPRYRIVARRKLAGTLHELRSGDSGPLEYYCEMFCPATWTIRQGGLGSSPAEAIRRAPR